MNARIQTGFAIDLAAALAASLLILPAVALGQIHRVIAAPFPGERVAHDREVAAGDLSGKAAFGLQYDDGEADFFLSPGSTTFEVAMLFDGIGGSDLATLAGVEVCFRQGAPGPDTKLRYEVVIWAADGPGGGPGAELAHYAAVAEGVTNVEKFYHTDIDFSLVPSDVFVGVRWHPAVDLDFLICGDNDRIDGAVHPGFTRADETGAWTAYLASHPDYKAFMIRGFVTTPLASLEMLLVPSFLVDTASGAGSTTLFAVRNLTAEAIDVVVEYFRADGANQLFDTFALGPRDTHTVNLRDVGGLAVDPDDFARGLVLLSTPGQPDRSPVIAGDFFQVDVGNDFATGDKLVRIPDDTCLEASIRFMEFPLPGSGSRLRAFVNGPRGTGAADPPSFVVDVYDESGGLAATLSIKTDEHVVDISPATLGSAVPRFGSMAIDFDNGDGGVVFGEYKVEGRFSVGVTSQCEGAP